VDPPVLADDEDARGGADVDSLAQGLVGLDLGAAGSTGIEDEGERLVVRGEPGAGEACQVVLVEDARLVGEDGEAELLGEGG
jgi:hypothetical protein